MIQIKSIIKDELVDLLEGVLYEMGESPWSIVQIKENDSYQLLGCFNNEEEAAEGWVYLQSEVNGMPEGYDMAEISDDWKDEYKKYLKPWNKGELHWVPEWMREAYEVPVGDVAFYVDAGMAFGTGMHETTQLCAERMLEFKEAEGRGDVIDAGCGSGILGISARLVGFENVVGFDIDVEAVRVARENAKINNVTMNFEEGGLEECLGGRQGDLVMANILANILSDNSAVLLNAVREGGWLVLSGILEEEVGKVIEVFETAAKEQWGKYDMESRVKGEWADVVIKRT